VLQNDTNVGTGTLGFRRSLDNQHHSKCHETTERRLHRALDPQQAAGATLPDQVHGLKPPLSG
jgi:hypothetical protein